MANYIIPIAKDLLEPKHNLLICCPLGLFLWLVDHTTKDVQMEDGSIEGLVYGGKPVSYEEIGLFFGCAGRRVRRWKEALEKWNYIRAERTNRYGMLRWTVYKSKKFKLDVSPQTDKHNAREGTCVSANGIPCVHKRTHQLEMQEIQTTYNDVAPASDSNTEAGNVETTKRAAKDVSPQTVKHLLSQFVELFNLSPHPLWGAKIKTLLAKHGEPAVLKAIQNAKLSVWWSETLSGADDAIAFFAKDSNFEKLLVLKPKGKKNPLPKDRWGATGDPHRFEATEL
jgi:hypothetical protein